MLLNRCACPRRSVSRTCHRDPRGFCECDPRGGGLCGGLGLWFPRIFRGGACARTVFFGGVPICSPCHRGFEPPGLHGLGYAVTAAMRNGAGLGAGCAAVSSAYRVVSSSFPGVGVEWGPACRPAYRPAGTYRDHILGVEVESFRGVMGRYVAVVVEASCREVASCPEADLGVGTVDVGRAVVSYPVVPCRVVPCRVGPCQVELELELPFLGEPCQVVPFLREPCRVVPFLEVPCREEAEEAEVLLEVREEELTFEPIRKTC
mmetsp:Transcript_51631/g.62221  ORF Transcript_51631/g.62221 Transcript_51631/m.62221 type:complete len:262 (-) Transcript_51631:183-968(-)